MRTESSQTPIHHLTIVRYYRDGRHWDTERIESPPWTIVEGAIRRMDNYCFPIVLLEPTDEDWGEKLAERGRRRWPLGAFSYDGQVAV